MSEAKPFVLTLVRDPETGKAPKFLQGRAHRYLSEDGRYDVSVEKHDDPIHWRRFHVKGTTTEWLLWDHVDEQYLGNGPDTFSAKPHKTLAALLEWFEAYLGRPIVVKR